MTRKQGAVRQGFVVDEGNQETEIEFLRATIYLHEVEPRIQAISGLNRFSTEPDVAHRMLWNKAVGLIRIPLVPS